MKYDSNAFRAFIGISTFTKLLMNTTRRMVYPFAPEFARGLNVDLSAITSLIAVNQATAVLGPVGASFADRYGYKLLMLLAVGIITVGCFAVGLLPLYSVVLISLFLAGLAKNIFDPSVQALIGAHVPYEHRGKFIGIMEIAWAGATLAGIPLTGILIERYSWQTPFWVLGFLSLVCFFLLLKLIPGQRKDESEIKRVKTEQSSILANWKTIIQDRKVLGMLGFVFFMSLANDNLFVIYGAWLEDSYGLSLTAIGFGTILIGMAEILGEGMTALFSDRIGLKKSVAVGTAVTALAYLMLPLSDIGLEFVLTGLFILFFCFEFTIVSSMSLGTELVPELRAATMSSYYAVGGIGRVIGAFAGGLVWSGFGIWGICLLSGICSALALVAILVGLSKAQ
ncbi:MAG: MFS transporter [Desulfobacterales bacterium]|nr:MFS transporter [Desulfobacterales bacterium]